MVPSFFFCLHYCILSARCQAMTYALQFAFGPLALPLELTLPAKFHPLEFYTSFETHSRNLPPSNFLLFALLKHSRPFLIPLQVTDLTLRKGLHACKKFSMDVMKRFRKTRLKLWEVLLKALPKGEAQPSIQPFLALLKPRLGLSQFVLSLCLQEKAASNTNYEG